MNRQEFLRSVVAAGALAISPSLAQARTTKRPRAITMWDFSWLERRWPGAGYEDWDLALDELAERGYDAARIDCYPHLIAEAPEKSWLLKPLWDTQDWGAPTLVRVRVRPELHDFIAKCRDRDIKVALSTWFRQDEDDVRLKIAGPERLAEVWNTTLAGIKRAGLLDNILYVDLCNEWPSPIPTPFLQPPIPDARWNHPRSLNWMRRTVAAVRREYPAVPLVFSTNNERVEDFADQDVGFLDAIEHHVWMVGENDDEFYRQVGYTYQRFSQAGYHNVQLKAADLYAARPAYWQKLLTNKIARLASVSERSKQPLMITECWAIVDYKDWPLLPWDWVKDVCALGTLEASATGRWLAVATSNFCGPQFKGMWRDIGWHRRLTKAIKAGPIAPALRSGRLWDRL